MDVVSDMITRIRNAQMVRHESVRIPFSNLKWQIAELLEKEGYIEKAEKKGRFRERRMIEIKLKYENGQPKIRELRRISKPGRRVYAGCNVRSKKAGRQLVLSTSKGIMTDKEARKLKIGGEVLFEIW